jgi:hypothetical protein
MLIGKLQQLELGLIQIQSQTKDTGTYVNIYIYR